MALPPRISTPPVGGSHITYTAVAQPSAPRAVQETVPFNSVQWWNAESLLAEMERQHLPVINAVVKRAVSQLESTLMGEAAGAASGTLPSTLRRPAWTLWLEIAGKLVSVASEQAFAAGDTVRLRPAKGGWLLLPPAEGTARTSPARASSPDMAAPLYPPAPTNTVQLAVDEALRLALPRQLPLASVATTLQRLLPALLAMRSEVLLAAVKPQDGSADDVTTKQWQQMVQTVEQWLRRVPTASTLLQQPDSLRTALRDSAVPLERRIAQALQQLPPNSRLDARMPVLSDKKLSEAVMPLLAEDTRALLLKLAAQLTALKQSWPATTPGQLSPQAVLQESLMMNQSMATKLMATRPMVENQHGYLLEQVEKPVQAALSRVVVQLLQSLLESQSGDGAATNAHAPADKIFTQGFHSEILLRHGEQFHSIPVHVTREEHKKSQGNASAAKEYVWQVNMDFDLGERGTMRAVIRSNSQSTHIVLQTQNASLSEAIAKHQAALERRLLKRGVVSVAIQQGSVPSWQPSEHWAAASDHHFIDVLT